MDNQKKPQDDFETSVNRKADIKLRAKREQHRSVWFGLGMFGLVGWAVVVPTLIGVMLGMWLDDHLFSHVSWTLNLLIVGLIIGCFNAWFWVQKENKK